MLCLPLAFQVDISSSLTKDARTHLGPTPGIEHDIRLLGQVAQPFPAGLLYFDADATLREVASQVLNTLQCCFWDAALVVFSPLTL